ncbi:hypothetical protein V8D89_008558 [Ganoderma adspersum]
MLASDSSPRVQCATAVHLLSGSDIESFINAVSANEVDVLSIQSFRISAGNISRSVGDAFAGFIVKYLGMLKIRHLEIHHAEEFLASSYRLASAFAACTAITHFTLDEVGDHGRELLVKSRFSLVSANLTMPDLDDEGSGSSSERDDDSDDSDSDNPNGHRDQDYYVRHNPIVLLRNSRRTLESLTGSGCKTLCTKAKTIKDLSFKHVYPRLTSLSLHQCAEVPFAFRLVSAFPNLRILHVSFALDAIMASSEAVGSFRVRRRANQDKQRVFGAWKSLLECHAPLLEHYLLGLTCRVERLHILGDYMDHDVLAQVLRTTAPEHLCLDGFDADGLSPGLAEALSQLGHDVDVVARLGSLEVLIDLGSTLKSDNIDVEQTLTNMGSALRHLQIRSFSLSLAVSIHGKPRPPLELVPMCVQERYLEALDLDSLATRIRTSVPSLQTVAIKLCGHPTRPVATAMHEVVCNNAVPMVCDSSVV